MSQQSSDGTERATPFSAEEMRAYNATLTRADTRPRVYPKNAARGIARGRGSGINPGQPANYTTAGPRLNSGWAGYGSSQTQNRSSSTGFETSNAIQSSNWSAPSLARSNNTLTAVLGAGSSANSNDWSTPSATNFQAVTSRISAVENQVKSPRAGSASLRPFENPRDPANVGREPIKSNWHGDTQGPAQAHTTNTATSFEQPGLRPFEDPNHPTNIGREPISTDMEPGGDFCAIGPQFKQRSASVCIREISEMTGIPYYRLTNNGRTIPAPRPRRTSMADGLSDREFIDSLLSPKRRENLSDREFIDSLLSPQRRGNGRAFSSTMPSYNTHVPNSSTSRSFDSDVEMEGAIEMPTSGVQHAFGNLVYYKRNTPTTAPRSSTETPTAVNRSSPTASYSWSTYPRVQARWGTASVVASAPDVVATISTSTTLGAISTGLSVPTQPTWGSTPATTPTATVAASEAAQPAACTAWGVASSSATSQLQALWDLAPSPASNPSGSPSGSIAGGAALPSMSGPAQPASITATTSSDAAASTHTVAQNAAQTQTQAGTVTAPTAKERSRR